MKPLQRISRAPGLFMRGSDLPRIRGYHDNSHIYGRQVNTINSHLVPWARFYMSFADILIIEYYQSFWVEFKMP